MAGRGRLDEETRRIEAEISRLQDSFLHQPPTRRGVPPRAYSTPMTEPARVVSHLGLPKPPSLLYDGKADWLDYIIQFERVAKTHGWDTEEKRYNMLIERLQGDALCVSTNVEENYGALVEKLKQRFAPLSVSRARNELRERRQAEGESFEKLSLDIERKVERAWPEADGAMREGLRIEAFKAALKDEEVKYQLLLREYDTLADLEADAHRVKKALEQTRTKASSTAVRAEKARAMLGIEEPACVTAPCGGAAAVAPVTANAELEQQVRLLAETVRRLEVAQQPAPVVAAPTMSEGEQICRQLEELKSTVDNLKRSQSQGGPRPRRPPPTCFACGRMGHIRAWCQYNPAPAAGAAVMTSVPPPPFPPSQLN